VWQRDVADPTQPLRWWGHTPAPGPTGHWNKKNSWNTSQSKKMVKSKVKGKKEIKLEVKAKVKIVKIKSKK